MIDHPDGSGRTDQAVHPIGCISLDILWGWTSVVECQVLQNTHFILCEKEYLFICWAASSHWDSPTCNLYPSPTSPCSLLQSSNWLQEGVCLNAMLKMTLRPGHVSCCTAAYSTDNDIISLKGPV